MISLESYGEFCWDFGQLFLITVDGKDYVWSDPEYGGDNTIQPYDGDPRNLRLKDSVVAIKAFIKSETTVVKTLNL